MNSTKKDQTCSSCGWAFVCDPQNISNCDCSKVELNSEERTYINSKFENCVCNACLIKLKTELKVSRDAGADFKNIRRSIHFIFFVIFSVALNSQTYAPPVGQAGTTAIYKDSSVFVNWASACTVVRGYQDVSNTSLGLASVGDESMALGKAISNAVLSLGDGGSAVCTFNFPIINGSGYDFAVFENSIDDTFLELAFVEVSSDGVNFFRFRSHSLTDTLTQTGSFGSTDATKINNLAGKYRAGYGTPFDLQELAGTNGLNVNAITHIKIVDVIGSMNPSYANRDGFGNKVNDPWPTAFPSGGFDLDAIGVIHENKITSISENSVRNNFNVYPNPVEKDGDVFIRSSAESKFVEIYSLDGRLVLRSESSQISTAQISSGIYLLRIETAEGIDCIKLLVK